MIFQKWVGIRKYYYRQFVIGYRMNEINLVFLGLIALVASVILLWVLEVPEIIEYKKIEIITALGIGLL
jgi:hypothetical protein